MTPVTGSFVGNNPSAARRSRYPVWAWIAAPLCALFVQVYLPLFHTLRFAATVDLPLLVTIYFALMRRSQIRGLTTGMLLGFAQDSFSQYYVGMFGLSKTLVGYFAASIGTQFDVENTLVRFFVCLVFYPFHQFLYWVLQRAVLDQAVDFDPLGHAIMAVVHAVLGILIFRLLDKLRIRE